MRALDVVTFGYTENLRAKQWPVIRTQTEQFLELFHRTLNFFLCLIDVKISLNSTVLIVRGCFDRMHRFE